MKIVKKKVYKIKNLGGTYCFYFQKDKEKYSEILPKMDFGYIVNQIKSFCNFKKGYYESHESYQTREIAKKFNFILIETIEDKRLETTLYLLYNKDFDFYVLISEKEVIEQI